MAEAHGFPELASNVVYGENFDPTIASDQGILVVDVTTGIPSPLVIPTTSKFTMATKLLVDGFWGLAALGVAVPFTINYFLESLTSPSTVFQFTTSLTTNQGTLIGGQAVYDVGITVTSQIDASTITPGTYRLTAQQRISVGTPFTASSYVTGQVLEIFKP
jgi:hypothetical protein